MGFMRKNAIFWTGGAARVVINPNSKKARTAKATEKMLKLQKAQAKRARNAAAVEALTSRRGQRSSASSAPVEVRADHVCEMCGKAGHGRDYHVPGTHRPPQAVAPKPARPVAATASSPRDPALAAIEQLKQLDELRVAGVLTADEFTAKKAQILDRI